MGRSSRKKSKARQTTLTQFPILSTAGPSGCRRSAREAATLEDSPRPPPSPLPTIQAKAKQPKLKLGKGPRLTHNAPILPPPKSPDFAVVIITSATEGSSSQQTLEPIGWFPPPVQNRRQDVEPLLEDKSKGKEMASQDVEPLLEDKSKGKEMASQDAGTSDSEDEDPVLSSVRKRKAGTRVATTDKAAQDDSDEDIVIASSPSSPKKRLWVANLSTKEQGDDGPAPKCIRQAENSKKPTPEQAEVSGDDDDDDAPITPARRRGKVDKGKGKQVEELPRYDLEDEEKEDLEEDLAFMAPEHHILSSRTRYNGSSPKRTPYQRKLDELRAKRAGKEIQPSTSNDDQPKRALYDTDPEDNSLDEEGGDSQHLAGDYSSDNESWIIEDDGTLGAPDPENQIPIQFTSLSHQSTRTNFKVVCLWIVQNILNPSFPSDELSVFALRALERRIDSYGCSVLQSSAWKAPFMRAMKARPCFNSEPCAGCQICDACHISGRTATYAVTITGSRYDPSTLEDLEGSDDGSEDSTGLEIPGEETVFYLGRHCHARAQMSHAFIHWKKQLRDAIETILEQQGYFTPYWASKAATMDVEGRAQWANHVTDNLGDHIQEFYHDLKRSLEDAQTNMANQRSKKWR